MKSSKFSFICAAALFLVGPHALAANCTDYPYSDGMTIESVVGGIKILATASATPSGTDAESIKNAREEATLEAKAIISKFLNQDIKSEELFTKIISESKYSQGAQNEVQRKSTIERVKRIQNSSSALLKGVLILGDCYTKGQEVRVSVGIKPETIAASEKLSSSIKNSANSQSQNGVKGSDISSELNAPGSFSNTKNLNKF